MGETDRLRWRCRRGLLELDLILQRFLDETFPTLPEVEREAFRELLSLDDDSLLGMILGRSPAGRWERIIERLRRC